MAPENKLDSLKKSYLIIEKKHNLPSFEELNKEFQIEKISESETDFLIREVRKYLTEKLSFYLRFVENLLNPVNVPVFVFSLIKSLTADDKNKLSEIYKNLAKMEVKVLELDLDFSEKKEVEFIKEYYKEWQNDKKILLEIVHSINSKWDDKTDDKKNGYFG